MQIAVSIPVTSPLLAPPASLRDNNGGLEPSRTPELTAYRNIPQAAIVISARQYVVEVVTAHQDRYDIRSCVQIGRCSN